MTGKHGPLEERFWRYVDKTDGCWLWVGMTARNGYGKIRSGGHAGPLLLAHRVAYELEHGPIPEGLHIDHLCRVRHCVNPAHLEPVTCRVNIIRGEGFAAKNYVKTHCKHGHPFDLFNTYWTRDGKRMCRACKAAWAVNNRKRANGKTG